MSGRVLRFEGPAHIEAERLLPWLVNGTLEGEERALVEQHLAECVQCQRDVALLRSLQTACRDEVIVDPGAVDAEYSLQRLRRRIDAERSSHRILPRHWDIGRSLLHAAIAVQAVIIIALAFAWWHAGQPVYRTLGATDVPAARLVVVFDPHLSEQQMRLLIRASDAHIVDGPTDAGAYILSVPQSRSDTVREALRAAPGVTLVENLDSGRH